MSLRRFRGRKEVREHLDKFQTRYEPRLKDEKDRKLLLAVRKNAEINLDKLRRQKLHGETYSRISRLIAAGYVERKEGKLYLTWNGHEAVSDN